MTTQTTTPTLEGTYAVEPVHSSAGFAVKHMAVSTFRGRFEDVEGRLVAENGSIVLEGRVDASSIVVKDEDLAAHLRSEDFFDVERHPHVTYRSASLNVAGDGSVVSEGELTVKGITKPVRATGTLEPPVEDPYGGTRAGLDLETRIDRRDFGLEWNMPLPKGGLALGNEVTISVHLELVREG